MTACTETKMKAIFSLRNGTITKKNSNPLLGQKKHFATLDRELQIELQTHETTRNADSQNAIRNFNHAFGCCRKAPFCYITRSQTPD